MVMLSKNALRFATNKSSQCFEIRFTYSHPDLTAFYIRFTVGFAKPFKVTDWNCMIVIWLLFCFFFCFLPMILSALFFYGSKTMNNNGIQSTSQSVDQLSKSTPFFRFCCRFHRSNLTLPPSTNDCKYIFFIDHFLNFIAEHCKVALLSSSVWIRTIYILLNLSECSWMHAYQRKVLRIYISIEAHTHTYSFIHSLIRFSLPWFIHDEFGWMIKQNVRKYTIHTHYNITRT